MTIRTVVPAIAGGAPVRLTPLAFARPRLGTEEEDAAIRVIRSGWLTTGPESLAFEHELASYIDASHVVALSSCTAALHLAVAGLAKPGSEVITTSFTFASSVAAILYAGCIPVLVDVRPDDLTIDPDRVAAAVTSRTAAVLAVDYGGQPARLSDLRTAAPNVPLIEDAAHSFGAKIEDRWVGGIADATCLSFYANKNITTGEGGALATNDARLAELARELRLHGMSADAWRRYLPGGSAHYDIKRPGFKYNLSDLAAAIGRAQLPKELAHREQRTKVAEAYGRQFRDIEDYLSVPSERPGTTSAWHLFPVRLNLARLRATRDEFLDAMKAEGISCSVHFLPVHQFTAYRSIEQRGGLDVSESAGRSVVSLPIWPGLTDADVADVVAAVRKLVRYYAIS